MFFRKWIEESELDVQQDLYDNSVMSVRQWMAVLSVMLIPILNIAMIFYWAFAEKELTNSNKVNWARASVVIMFAFVTANVALGIIVFIGWYMT